jgi:hypothetical protein
VDDRLIDHCARKNVVPAQHKEFLDLSPSWAQPRYYAIAPGAERQNRRA